MTTPKDPFAELNAELKKLRAEIVKAISPTIDQLLAFIDRMIPRWMGPYLQRMPDVSPLKLLFAVAVVWYLFMAAAFAIHVVELLAS